ncbi:unnamed protein product [Miscanthus lutarioriparius]|uniref:Uncharacterized protein n=1 Tax=Miscanthus lutarioriparius TaxID=422564 RepID=A0A811QMP3_9POAL|nr:unnamed protein product [Miscanthus lutarioriparius]
MVLPPEASRAVFISVIGEAAAVEELAAVIALRLGAEDDPLALRRASPASFLLVLPDGAAVARRVRSLSPQLKSGRRPVWVRLGPTASCNSYVEATPSARASTPAVGTEEPHLNSRGNRDVPLIEAFESTSTPKVGAATSTAHRIRLNEEVSRPIGKQGLGDELTPSMKDPGADLKTEFVQPSPTNAAPPGLMEGAGPGPDEAQGPIADNFVMGHGEATEGNPLILPASPCLPPHPTSGLATEENPPRSPVALGSPWTSPPPEFRSLGSPPGLGKHSTNPLQVYSRRRSRPCGAALPESSTLAPMIELEAEVSPKSPCIPAGDVAAPAPSPAATPLNHDTFISKLSRRTASLLLVPTISKRHAKALPPGETPRRSRRLVGAVAEFQQVDWKRRSKKKVMRSLEIISEQNGVCQQAEEEYCKLFENPLPDIHLIGLAALFNWSIPEFCEDDDQVGEDVVAT